MPNNLHGPGDNYHPQNSHVIPALIRRFHEAKARGDEAVTIWSTGSPLREFMYSDDMADACVFLMNLPDSCFQQLQGADRNHGVAPLVNVGLGVDLSILQLAQLVAEFVNFKGAINTDPTKPDGTPRKLMDVSRLINLGWCASAPLMDGLKLAYALYPKPDMKSSANRIWFASQLFYAGKAPLLVLSG